MPATRTSIIAKGGQASAIALAVLMTTAFAAWAQAPTPFDGDYAGTATPAAGRQNMACEVDLGLQMAIAAGRVTVRTVRSNGAVGRSYVGTVDPSGRVSASTRGPGNRAPAQTGDYAVLSGSLSGANFVGTIDGVRCRWQVSAARR